MTTNWLDTIDDGERGDAVARYVSGDDQWERDEDGRLRRTADDIWEAADDESVWECPHCLRAFPAAFPWEDEATGREGVVCPGCGLVTWDGDEESEPKTARVASPDGPQSTGATEPT